MQKTFGALQLDRSNYAPFAGEAGREVAGLPTADRLAKDHGIEAQVLEAGHIGWGASGRNGGFYEVAHAAKVVPELAESQNLLARHFGIDSRVLPAEEFAAADHRARRRQARDQPRTGKGSSSV